MFTIVDMKTIDMHRRFYDTEHGAKIAAAVLNKRRNMWPVKRFIVMTPEMFQRYLDPIVIVYNSITGDGKTPIKIHRSLEGGCCDPSTETYHCM